MNKLGKLPAKHDPRTLRLSKYLALPAAPDPIDWGKAVTVPWGIDGNDQYGDCFWAMGAHALMTWTANAGSIFVPTTEQVLAAYSAATGFDPSDPKTDQGTVMLDGLKFLRSTGIGGQKIGAFVAVDPKNHAEVMSALYLFGALLIGVQFPKDWMDAPVWDVTSSPIEGGHAIVGVKGSLAAGLLEIITWGEGRTLTLAGLDQNCDELFVSLPPEWIEDSGKAPNGFDAQALTADLAAVTATTPPDQGASRFTISRQASSANTLMEPRVTHEYIREFNDPSYVLIAPIPIQFERGRLGYTAIFDEANIAISGVSKFDALSALEIEIADAFDDWIADESMLGPGPQQQLAVLKRFISKRPANG